MVFQNFQFVARHRTSGGDESNTQFGLKVWCALPRWGWRMFRAVRSSNGGVWTPELGYRAPAILDSASDGLICLSVPDNSLNMDPYRYPVEAGDPVQLSPVRTTNAGQGFQGFLRPTA